MRQGGPIGPDAVCAFFLSGGGIKKSGQVSGQLRSGKASEPDWIYITMPSDSPKAKVL